MRATRFPVRQHQFVLALVMAVKINQLTGRSGQGNRCDALRMINLDAPQMALLGDTIRLTCSFRLAGDESQNSRQKGGATPTGTLNHDVRRVVLDKPKQSRLADRSRTLRAAQLFPDRPRRHSSPDDAASGPPELLYAIKWYKDDREFYQFVTRNWPHKHALPMVGLNIDMDKSDNQTVVLRDVSLKTSGLFRCEVSTDAPWFVTKSIERKIFIYSLPVEGPIIQTSPSASGPRRHNLKPGDQLELHCLSRDSKPGARLDWIINDRVNLTESIALSPSGARMFDVGFRRLVVMPTLVTMSARPPAHRSNSIHADDRLSVSSASNPLQRRLYNETTYEVVENQDRTLLQPVGDSGANTTIDANTLDQFPEASVSVLNFTVDTNLIQFIQINASSVPPIGSHNQRTPSQKLVQGSGMKAARNVSSLGLSFKTRKPNENQKRAGLGRQSEEGQRLALDVRCVARVMHLSMSDEIRLKIIDRPISTQSSSLELRRQENMTHKSSAVMLYDNRTLRYLFTCLLTWMMFRE